LRISLGQFKFPYGGENFFRVERKFLGQREYVMQREIL
jgi:hypothetical protein